MQPVKMSNYSAKQWQFLACPTKYVDASKNGQRPLELASTTRQFLTAQDILARFGGCYGQKIRKGVLLADDVGLGKTTVAALVAWVFALAGEKRKVRILVPNDVMVRRWETELKSHVELLKTCATNLKGVDTNRIKTSSKKRHNQTAGSIHIVKHSDADKIRPCDLLIVDEAHRAKGEGTTFGAALEGQIKKVKRVLILTATPFSIHIAELNRMLTLVGAGDAHTHAAVKSFSRALDKIYRDQPSGQEKDAANDLVCKANKAIEAVQNHVIRHSIDDLPKKELGALGQCEEWKLPVDPARLDELELLLRMDRLSRIAKDLGIEINGATNDVRFHVGWQHFDETLSTLTESIQTRSEPDQSLMESLLKRIKKLRQEIDHRCKHHSKIQAVAKAVVSTVNAGEKLVIFCHHIATAQEVTRCLAQLVPPLPPPTILDAAAWRSAWQHVFEEMKVDPKDKKLCDTFIEWLCSDTIRAQTQSWFKMTPNLGNGLRNALKKQHARHHPKQTIAMAARELFQELLNSRSSKAVLREAANNLDWMPGVKGKKSTGRVLGVCEPKDKDIEALFMRNKQPDTVIKVFGSPFGPDVLVVTDRLSEGIDLHSYCRHLIHYELDASPIRTVQRNGRIRRVQSWAAVTRKKVCYAYPAFGGTRDQRLVEIMKKRVAEFSLLLGGVSDFSDQDKDINLTGADEIWRSEVVQQAQIKLKKAGKRLVAKRPD